MEICNIKNTGRATEMLDIYKYSRLLFITSLKYVGWLKAKITMVFDWVLGEGKGIYIVVRFLHSTLKWYKSERK